MSLLSPARRRERVAVVRARVSELFVPEGLPETVRGGRIALDRRSVAALVCVALLGVLVAGFFAWRGSSTEGPAGRTSLIRTGAAASSPYATGAVPSAGPSATVAPLVVDVAGRVRRPGLVRLPAGSRVADALLAAGGVLPGVDLATINLARPVVDGEQILVGVGVGGGSGGGGSGGSGGVGAGPGGASGSSGPLDLNAATLAQLEALPGVGPVLAQRILDWRLAHGRFSAVGELREVGGIGAKKFADIEPKVRV
jgi:competence protein ComEA